MKFIIIIALLFISGYNCGFIEEVEQTAKNTDVLWAKDMVNRMKEQLKAKKLEDMKLSDRDPYEDVIGDLLNSSDITNVTCVKLLSPPNSKVIDDIEIEVNKKDGHLYVIQIQSNDDALSVVTKKLK